MVTMSKNETKAWKNSIKSMDTEEWIDLLFYRPVGYRWALLFSRLGVHPNTVTVISIFLGVAAAVLFYFDSVWLNMAGMCLLVWANMYDSADGQLARMTGQKSELGRILDGTSGILWFACIYAAIALRLTPEWGIWIWVVALINGFIHSKEAAMADYYRNIHLFMPIILIRRSNGVRRFRNCLPHCVPVMARTFRQRYANVSAKEVCL